MFAAFLATITCALYRVSFMALIAHLPAIGDATRTKYLDLVGMTFCRATQISSLPGLSVTVQTSFEKIEVVHCSFLRSITLR